MDYIVKFLSRIVFLFVLHNVVLESINFYCENGEMNIPGNAMNIFAHRLQEVHYDVIDKW